MRKAWSFISLAVGMLIAAAVPSHAFAVSGCPDIAGHYRVSGFGPVLGDSLQALNLELAGFTGSEVRITGTPETGLAFAFKSGTTGKMLPAAWGTLHQGVDFTCANGWLELRRTVRGASRQTDKGWHEGQAVVQLGRGIPRGLALRSNFSGSQRSTIYSYDSARISVPKLGTGIRLTEAIRWPDIEEPEAVAPAARTEPPEPRDVAEAREVLSRRLLGPVLLATLQTQGDAVRATLRATDSGDVIAFEDRLRAAGVPYEVKTQPVWSANAWHMEFLVRKAQAGASLPWRPSRMRVEHEVKRLGWPLADVRKVESLGESYVATVQLQGGAQPEAVAARLKSGGIIGEAAPLEAGAGNQREARLVLRVR